MTKKQISNLEMYEATNEYLNRHTAIWSAIPVLTTYKTELAQAIDGIQQSAQDQESAQVFISHNLRQLKQQVADQMDILDDALEAYADDTQNVELLAKASNTESDYFHVSHEDFETKTKNVIALLEAHVNEMADYGVTPDQIEDVKLTFDLFEDKRGKPRSYRIASRMATQNLADLFEGAKKTIERLDRVIKRFRRSNTIFYNGYQAARTIVYR